jgi:peptidoglycan/xylan/chitin deacetylase (PgdA/CDA1 family)
MPRLRLPDAVERLGRNALPARAVAITFDDGYADNLTVACPILARHGLHATFFVASGFLDGGIMWNDQAIEAVRGCAAPAIDLTPLGLGVLPLGSIAARRDALGRILPKLKYLSLAGRVDALSRLRASAGARPNPELMMTTAQLRALRDAGMEIGGHTCSHPILAVLPDDVARREIGADREQLAGILGQPPRLFAYPNGKPGEDYLPVHVEMVRALGYHHALSTQWGAAGRGSDRFQLPRFTPWDQDPRRFVLRLAHNFGRSRPADRKT